MDIVLALLQLLSIIFIILYEYNKKYLSIFLWATLLLLFGIPHFLTVIYKVEEFSTTTLNEASILVIVFNLIYFFSREMLRIVFGKPNLTFKSNEIFNKNKEDDKLLIIWLIILICCPMVLIILSVVFFGSILNASWGQFMTLNTSLGWFSPIKYILFFYFPAASAILIYRYKKRKIFYLLAIISIVGYVLISGNRVTILPLIVSFILPYIFLKNKKNSLKNIIILGLMGVFSVYLIYLLRLLRVYGGFYILFSELNIFEINNKVIEMLLTGDGELSLKNAFYYFIQNDNEFPGFGEGHTYIRLLLLAIPTSLSFGLKPHDFAITMGSAWINDFSNTVYSMTPTLYGDVFANFGWWALLSAVIWAFIAWTIDLIVKRRNLSIQILLMTLFATLYIAIGRGSVYNQFYIALIATILIFIFYLLGNIKIKRN